MPPRDLHALLATCLLALCSPAAAAAQDSLPAHPREIEAPPLASYTPPRPSEHTLRRGSRVLLLVDRELPLVDGRLRFRAGSLHEAPEQVGLTGVLAEALRGGGAGGEGGLLGPDLDAWLDARGARLAVHAGLDEIQLAFSCLRTDLPRLLELLSALLREPLYPEAEVERAVLRLRTEIARRDDDSGETAERLLLQVVYGADSPFARVPSQATAGRIDRGALLRFHREHLGADRLLIGLAGDLATDEALSLLEDAFGDLPQLGPPPEPPSPTFRQPARTSVFVHDRPGVPQTQIRMAAPGVRRLDEDAAALRLFTLAVGAGGFTNRMMLRVRTELGLAYDVGAAFVPGWERRGTFQAWCGTRNEALGEAVNAMLAVLRGSLSPLAAEELESARARDAQHRMRDFRDPPAILDRALDLAFHGYPIGFWETHARRLREVDAAGIAAAAARHLDPGRLVIVAVGPADRIVPQLAHLGPIERLDAPPSAPAGLGESAAATARVEELLAALGGRQAWSAARYLEVHGRISSRAADLESRYEVRTWYDLEGPRMRAVHRTEGADTSLVLTVAGARLRHGDAIQVLPEARHREHLAAARRDLFRLLYLAALDRVEARAVGERGLVLKAEDGPELHLELDARGLPVAARALEREGEREVVYRYEGWTAAEHGLRFPARIHKEGAEPWTRELSRFEVHPQLEEGLFEQP